jgi:hypothetical protein
VANVISFDNWRPSVRAHCIARAEALRLEVVAAVNVVGDDRAIRPFDEWIPFAKEAAEAGDLVDFERHLGWIRDKIAQERDGYAESLAASGMNTPTIERALRDPGLFGAALGPIASWRTWLIVLKAAFGIVLDPDELALFAKLAGGRQPPAQMVRELWAVAGRRSGKSRMAAAIVVFIAVFLRHRFTLAPGEVGTLLCLSASKDQAKQIKDYCLAYLQESPMLRSQVVNVTAEEIELANGVIIGIHTNSFRTIRGRTLLATVFDESAFWRDETSAIPDVEVHRAVKPSLDASGGMLVGISSPYRKVGLLAARHRDHFGKDSDVLVIQAPTATLNPTIDPAVIGRAYIDDPASAAAEWGAEFRTDLSSLFADDVIDGAIDHDRPLELAPQSGITYKCFVDASAGRHDAFTLCIGHVTGDGEDKAFIADVVRAREPPFDNRTVATEYADLARTYGITELVGDNFAGEWVSQSFRDAGIGYRKSDLVKSALYLEALSTFNTGRVELPNDAKLIRELRMLERATHRSGKDTVDHPKSGSDDRANVLCGAMWICGVAGTKRRGEASVGYFDHSTSRISWPGERGTTVREQLERRHIQLYGAPEQSPRSKRESNSCSSYIGM